MFGAKRGVLALFLYFFEAFIGLPVLPGLTVFAMDFLVSAWGVTIFLRLVEPQRRHVWAIMT